MKYLITGSGYLASHIINKLQEENAEIYIYSRSEKEQWKLRTMFNNIKCIIGDIRDYDALLEATKGIDYVIHTGAIKRIDVAESQPMEAIKTNVIGSMNVINACVKNNVKRLVLISTDKATSATTCYGSTKFLMECMAKANTSETVITLCRYGNVYGSTGSVVPIFCNLKKENKPITIRNGQMTRFFMSVNEAVDLVLNALKKGNNGELWVYKNKSCTIQELADTISDNQIVIGTENVEKNDEALLTIEELNHSRIEDNYYIVSKELGKIKYEKPLTSDNAERITKEELEEMLKEWENDIISIKL